MALLTQEQIIEGLAAGNIVIQPYNGKQLNNASYNLTLGRYYFRQVVVDGPIDITSKPDVRRMWQGPLEANDMGEILMQPGDILLVHSNEFAGTRWQHLPFLRARSTCMRLGLQAIGGAGQGDVGYYNRWSWTLFNPSRNTIKLKVGFALVQLVFETTLATTSYAGHYQDSSDLVRLMVNWQATDILPVT